MPLTVPAGLLTKANFVIAYLKPLVDANETNAASALSTAQAANTLAGQKYAVPGGSSVVLSGGSVTRIETLTQAAYDALATKGSTTLYIIS